MKKISLLLLFTSLCLFTNAQQVDPLKEFDISHSGKRISIDSVAEIYNTTALYLDANGKYIIGDQEIPVGFFNKHLKKELKRSPEAGAEMKIFGRKTTRGFVLVFGSVLGAGIVFSAGSVLGAVFIVPYFIGAINFISAQKHFQKAIWAHNRDAVLNGINKK